MRHTTATVGLASMLIGSAAEAAHPATAQEVADFWETVFAGPPPHGVPPLAASRTNPRPMGGVMVWDVSFDSYRDPDTDQPVRIFGYLAVPTGMAPPGPNGTYPGLVNTHSVGGCPACSSPNEGLDTAIYYAERGFAALAFYLRGYAPSVMTDPALNAGTSNVALCSNLVDDGAAPYDTLWAGYPVDLHQAADFMAAQPEVWIDNGLSFIGHSLGGHAAVMAGVFSDRYRVIAASAPPTTGSDIGAWFDFGNPIASCVQRLPGSASTNRALGIRMVSYIGVYQAINNPLLFAKNPEWRLDDTEIFFYGGEQDTAVPPADVEESYLLADASNNKALHWSPTGGHGGPESFYRSDAWLFGHLPGKAPSPPTADLAVDEIDGLTVTFSARGSADDAIMIAYDYDFGDGETRNWGDTVTHTYPAAGTYTAALTVTDGEGRRDTASVEVTVGGVAAVEIVASANAPIVVKEGTAVEFTVNLSAPPAGVVTIQLGRDSGDTDLSIEPASLGFSEANWSTPHPVTISAAPDPDPLSGAAVFGLRAAGLEEVLIDAIEDDDDATFAIAVGTATVVPGSVADVPITLTNASAARIESFSVTLRYPEEVLGVPSATRGSIVPGPAWWMFGASNPASGTQLLSGSQIVQPEGPPIDGVLATDRFTIPDDAPPGVYALSIEAADVDGAPTDRTTAGFIRVIMPRPKEEPTPEPDLRDRSGATGGCGCQASGAPGSGPWLLLLVALWRVRRRSRPEMGPTSS